MHGVALPVSLARKFSALVWCPASNNFLLGQTARVSELKHHLPILFGTDSTLTGVWDIWQHIRHARQTGLLTDGELWNSLNTMPASAWQIDTGIIAQGYDADLIVVKRKTEDTRIQTALATTPEDILLVIHKGTIRLLDEMLYPQLTYIKQDGFSKIKIGRKYKYVAGDLPLLIEKISHYYPGAAFPVSAA